jgi:hypothetical protein
LHRSAAAGTECDGLHGRPLIKFDLIQSVIDLCDYYVVVVGGRYGSVDPEAELSYTELEYDYAVETGTPIMAFLHGDPGRLTADRTELDSDLREKLSDFRKKTESSRTVKYWHDPGDLKGQVALAILQIRRSHPAEGWIRASQAMTPETERELAELRQRVAELTSELGLEKRQYRPEDTEHLAQGDDALMLDSFVEYHSKENVEAGTAYANRRLRAHGDFQTTWNDLLAYIGLSLMDECSEQQMSSEIDSLAYKIVETETERVPDFGSLMEVGLSGECFDGIKVQLSALGLIERSTDRRRAVSDTATYWKLTEHGHDALLRLRAMRRPSEKVEPRALEDAD